MNRTDRLVATVMLLQSHRVITAARIASHFEITERTVYRDLAALSEAGVPILAEAGVGYSLMRGYHLPPVMFTQEEAMALVTGGLLVEQMTDPSVREAMRSAMRKVRAALPEDLQGRIGRLHQATLVDHRSHADPGRVPLTQLQVAVSEARVLRMLYHGRARREPSRRDVEPLGLIYYHQSWHLIAWCRLRNEVRDFRVDRIQECQPLPERAAPRIDFDLVEYARESSMPTPIHSATLELPANLVDSARRQLGCLLLDLEARGENVLLRVAYWELAYLAHWILGWGPRITIHDPEELRCEVAALAEATRLHHAGKSAEADLLLT